MSQFKSSVLKNIRMVLRWFTGHSVKVLLQFLDCDLLHCDQCRQLLAGPMDLLSALEALASAVSGVP